MNNDMSRRTSDVEPYPAPGRPEQPAPGSAPAFTSGVALAVVFGLTALVVTVFLFWLGYQMVG